MLSGALLGLDDSFSMLFWRSTWKKIGDFMRKCGGNRNKLKKSTVLYIFQVLFFNSLDFILKGIKIDTKNKNTCI